MASNIPFGAGIRDQAADPEQVYTSILSGHGVYVPTGAGVDVFGEHRWLVQQAGDSSGARYYLAPLPSEAARKLLSGGSKALNEASRHWRAVVRLNLWFLGFVWPVDVARTAQDAALVFPCVSLVGYKPLSALMPNWAEDASFEQFAAEAEEQRVLRLGIVLHLLRAWETLNQLGYLFLDYDTSHIFYNDEGRVVFAFNPYAVRLAEGKENMPVPLVLRAPDRAPMPLDYVDPLTYRLVNRTQKSEGDADAKGQTIEVPVFPFTEGFAMRAMTYRLLVGCLPFYGPRISAINDSADVHEKVWLKTYQGLYDYTPLFGFDTKNTSNRIDADEHPSEAALVRNWEFISKLDGRTAKSLGLELDREDVAQLVDLRAQFLAYFDSVPHDAPTLRPYRLRVESVLEERWDTVGVGTASEDVFRNIDANDRRLAVQRALVDVTPTMTGADFNNKVRIIAPLCERKATGKEGEPTQETQYAVTQAVARLLWLLNVPDERVNAWLGSEQVGRYSTSSELFDQANELYEERRWWRRDYSRARACYTVWGARPLSLAGRTRLLDLYHMRKENVRTLACAAAYVVLIAVFVMMFGANIASHVSLAGQGALCWALALAVLAFAAFRFKKKPFNGLSGLVGALYVLWLVYALVAV